jgi:DNA-binding beta-propeller fold protein YncE
MRLYIRKDVAAQLWDYATGEVPDVIIADPYEGGQIQLTADALIGLPGSEPGQFQNPRGLALAPDGSLYIADSDNHRIQHLSPEGDVLHVWGSFADLLAGAAPGGTFNQPWGVAVGPNGDVYVADTWNHRIQKFSAQGEFLATWGYFGQAEAPEAFWGPRDLTVDNQGRVFVTDTGNKRVVVFDENGGYITQFGGFGLEPGRFDEPVGIYADENGRIYVADTWNQRIQVFEELQGEFVPFQIWDISAWYGQSLENKPYLTVDPAGQVLITDPEGARVIQFDAQGQFVNYWGSTGSGPENFGLVSGIAAGAQGGIWVSDPGNDRIMHFSPP